MNADSNCITKVTVSSEASTPTAGCSSKSLHQPSAPYPQHLAPIVNAADSDENAIIVDDDLPPPVPTTSPPRSPAAVTPSTPPSIQSTPPPDNNNSSGSLYSSRASTPRRSGSRKSASSPVLPVDTIPTEPKAWMPAYITTVAEKPLFKSSTKPRSGHMKGEINAAAMSGIRQDECDGDGVDDAVDTVSHLSRISSIIGSTFNRQSSLRKKRTVCNVL